MEMVKRKLFKRALPIILSVAMVFQSAPTTAFAAEGTTEPETAIEQTTGEVVDDEPGDNGAGSSEAVDGEKAGNEESKPTETQATAEETKPAETQQTEETKAAEEKETEEPKVTETESETAVEDTVDNAEAEKVKLTVTIDEAVKTQKSGITVKELRDAIRAAVKITPDTEANKNAVKPLTITVRESTRTEALADDVILKKGNDYSVDVVAELTDECKENYEIEQLV